MSPSLRNTISVKYFSFVPSDSSKLFNMLSRPKLQLWWDLYSFSFCWEIFSWYKIHITVVINMSTCPDWFILQHLHPVTSPQPPSQKSPQFQPIRVRGMWSLSNESPANQANLGLWSMLAYKLVPKTTIVKFMGLLKAFIHI